MTVYNFVPFRPATTVTDGATSGARALMAYSLSRWPYARSMGIYEARNVRGGSVPSHHAEGRALDIGIPQRSPGRADEPRGDRIVEALGRHGRRLGIDHMIWNRRIWSGRSPGGRLYTGPSPHYDRIHLGLTSAAASRLNLATLIEVLGRPSPRTHEYADPAMTHRVAASSLRIRSAPTTAASILDELGHDTEVEMLDASPTRSDGRQWVQVRAGVRGRNVTGWVAEEFLDELTPPPPTHRVGAGGALLQAGPTTGAGTIVELTPGTEVLVVDDERRTADDHRWVRARVRLGERTETGWIIEASLTSRR